MKHKKQFIARVIKDNPNTEISRLLQANDDCGFYEVCQRFLDVALNALKRKNDDGSLTGVFQDSDIDIAKENAVEFIKNNGIKDIDNFFKVLECEYPQSASPKDTRCKSALVQEKGTGLKGYVGTLYCFTHISDNVYSNMVTAIKKQLIEK